MSDAEIHSTFNSKPGAADINLIEGNKGLFDHLDVEGTHSNAALAKMLSAPVLIVIDTTGMTRRIAPLISDYLDFDPGVDIRGVILNKVGGTRHEGKLRAALERYADAVSAGVDVERLIEVAKKRPTTTSTKPNPDVRIAIARDATFRFYYPDDLEAFADAGAELVPFDTLSDPKLPEAEGSFIGGGFPETHRNFTRRYSVVPTLKKTQRLNQSVGNYQSHPLTR